MVGGVPGVLGPLVQQLAVVDSIVEIEFATTQNQRMVENNAPLTVQALATRKAVIRIIAQVYFI